MDRKPCGWWTRSLVRSNLFVVDVVMPQMRGDELARQLRQRDPDVKVLYFTGYSDRLFENRKTLWEHEAFIEKPGTVKGLREALSLLRFGHTHGPARGRNDDLVRDYYRCFNERRIATAGTLFAPDAVVEMPPFVERAHGSKAYTQFADTWLRAFPDAVFTMEQVEQRSETMCEVDLIATGTHAGPLDLGSFGLLRPSGVQLTLRMRELLDIRDESITYASLSFDLNGLVRQLNRIDYDRLVQCLDTIRQLAEELTAANPESERQREVIERLGQALDAARHAVRPQFKR